MEQENKTTFGATYVPPMADVIMIELSTMAPAISAAGCLVGDGASKWFDFIIPCCISQWIY